MEDDNEQYGFFTDVEEATNSVVQYVIKSNNIFYVRSFCIHPDESLEFLPHKYNTYNTNNIKNTNNTQRNTNQSQEMHSTQYRKIWNAPKVNRTLYTSNIRKHNNYHDDDSDDEDYENELEGSFISKSIGYVVLLFVFSIYIIVI
jgi:hypothetical protein